MQVIHIFRLMKSSMQVCVDSAHSGAPYLRRHARTEPFSSSDLRNEADGSPTWNAAVAAVEDAAAAP
ncbi:MAG TPA: hypothetical protein VJ885_17060, partial [Thermoanaerobaculia bacterium]|nr:hypothetical protein [Thermoanaerobaculia bacterium]